jgi:DNA repair protein RAD5
MGCIYNFLKLQGPEDIESSITRATANIETYTRQLSLFSNEFITEQTQEPCMICYDTLDKIVVTQCRHIFCEGCYRVFLERSGASKQFPCPACRSTIAVDTITRSRVHRPTNEDGSTNDPTLYHKRVVINGIVMKPAWKMDCINRFGSKMSVLLEYLGELLEISENRIILFSQYDNMLKLIGQVLDNYGIQHVYCKGSVFAVTKAITNFKKNDKIRIIMLSSETANSGNNLTEANHVIFIDVINQSPEATVEIEKQAIGRTVRLGQNKGVTVSRFIMRNTVEELQYNAIKYDMASAN